jgi:hypothetical protein
MDALERRLQRLESRRKPAGDALTKLQMLVDMGEAASVAKWPQAERLFALLRLAQERRKANKMCI